MSSSTSSVGERASASAIGDQPVGQRERVAAQPATLLPSIEVDVPAAAPRERRRRAADVRVVAQDIKVNPAYGTVEARRRLPGALREVAIPDSGRARGVPRRARRTRESATT
jgi:hypothetical protein